MSSLFDLGSHGVAIFFVLSGFVIAHTLHGVALDLPYVGRFALRRSIRLDPAYWLSIAVVVMTGSIAALMKSEPVHLPGTGQIFAHMAYMQVFMGYAQLNDVYWTLCYEVQFYMALILALLLRQKLGRGGVAVDATLFLAAMLWGAQFLGNPVQGLFVDMWHCFYLGALVRWAKTSPTAAFALLTLAAILLLSKPSNFTIACVITAAMLLAAQWTGYIVDGLNFRPLMFLGTISYSLYLIHNPVTGASFFLMGKLGMPEGASLAMTLTLCIASAYLFWRLVEQPSQSLAKKVRLRRSSHTESPSQSLKETLSISKADVRSS